MFNNGKANTAVDRGGTFIESGQATAVALSGSSIISQKRHPSNDAAAYTTRLHVRGKGGGGGEERGSKYATNCELFSAPCNSFLRFSPGLPWPVPLHLAACDHSLG